MSELNILEILDEAIVSARDTNYHEVHYGDDGCDGVDVGVVYSDIESVVHETAENIQLKFDALNEHLRLKEEECKQLQQDKAELVEALKSVAIQFDFDTNNEYEYLIIKEAKALLEKHK